MKIAKGILLFIFITAGIQYLFGQETGSLKDSKMPLKNWQLKSTVLVQASGKEISTGNFVQSGWYNVTVPTTVLNGLVKNGVYPDPRLGMNNYLIPDISDKFNAEHNLAKYSYLPNHENPWKKPYWFITKFELPANEIGKQVWLNFDGINYRGELWLNGTRIADSAEMAGMFRRFKYNITSYVKKEETNYLAVKIFPVDHPGIPGTQFKALGNNRGPAEDLFKDETLKISGGWDCALPVRDRNTGIYQDVYLTFTGNVNIVNPYIVTSLPLPDTTTAYLTISATLDNTSGKAQTGLLKGKIDLLTNVNMGDYVKEFSGSMKSINFEKEVNVPANSSVTVSLSYKDIAQLTIKNPHLWWPNGYGEQYLHNLKLTFEQDGKISDEKNVLFGIRQVENKIRELNGDYGRVFYINGKRIFCKGGWLQPDMLLDMNKERIYDEARLLADANMNMVASEDMPSPPEDFMEACDKYGLMLWETFYQCWITVPGTKSAYLPLDHLLAIENERDIILRYRNHPSLVIWCAENENVPGPDLYLALKSDLKELDNSRPFIPSSSIWWDWEKITPYIKHELPLGVTDKGAPGYSWHPYSYFFNLIDTAEGQMFRDELGVPSVPTLSSIKKFIFNAGSDESTAYFPLDSVWAEHGAWDVGGYAYKTYDEAIRNIYGYQTKSVSDYARIAQIVNADSYRAMFEAANSRMWDVTSGIMIWKLNSSYPDILWQLYDWFLNPNASYYCAKKACEPLHIQLNANDFEVSVINTYYKNFNGLTVRAKIIDFNLKTRWERSEEINVDPSRYQDVFNIPKLSKITPVYFVKLELVNKNGKALSSNLYWESSSEVAGSEKASENFSELSHLEYTKPELTYSVKEEGQEYVVRAKVKNSTDKLSFMNRLAIVRKDDNEEILPTYWQDNFITLFPGEERNVEARFAKKEAGSAGFKVVVGNE